MDGCEVYFTLFAKAQISERGLTADDEMLIAAVVGSEPLSGRTLIADCESLRAIKYQAIASNAQHEVSYVYVPNADIQLNGRDIAIVISAGEHESLSEGWPSPESVARIIEMIAELTRHVFV